MRHIGQELRLRPICQLGRFPRSSVLLDTVAQVEDHLIDLGLEGVHFTACLDRDEPTEVAVHGCRRDLGETTHLGRKVAGHGVHGHPE